MAFRSYHVDVTGASCPSLAFRAQADDVEVWIKPVFSLSGGGPINIGDGEVTVNTGYPLVDATSQFNSRVKAGDTLYAVAASDTHGAAFAVLVRSV